MFYINNEEWHIKFVSPNHPMMYRSDGSLTIGTCDDNSKTIYVNGNLRGSKLKKVICHEITHAAMFSYDIELSFQQEELLADLIATYGEEIITIANKVFRKLREGY
ncbi:MAG: metal-dependent hydrolase [Caudoviricetes sp.]|nr:MAG: metal-dependent hydrolase [Caudoviricetes sp.]